MEHQLWPLLEQHLAGLASPFNPRCTYQDKDIVRVFFWAALHDRPTCWACQHRNWPLHARKRPLPSPSSSTERTMPRSVIGRWISGSCTVCNASRTLESRVSASEVMRPS